jgi:hypothetical protein
MEGQSPASEQAADQRAPFGRSADGLMPAASFPGFATAPRGPRRARGDGAGARSAADRFGLDWAAAAPAVLAVAAEACARVPEEWEIEGPGISLSLGDAADLDPALLEAMLGPDGLGGEALGPQFGQHAAADALRPGPILAALTEQAVADAATLTDDQLAGALRAALRLETRAAWQQTTLVAEFARRRAAQLAEARASGVPKGRRPGEFPDDELASELLITRNHAAGRIEADLELTGRLPRTYAGMADGTISAARADTIAAATGFLSDEDAAKADEILAAAAPGLRVDQLGRKAAALEMKLDPEAVRIRKEHAKSTRQRVEVRRELSGNASLSGRELDTAQALACKAHIEAVAVKLRNPAASRARCRRSAPVSSSSSPRAATPSTSSSRSARRRPPPPKDPATDPVTPTAAQPRPAPMTRTPPAAPTTPTTPAPTTPAPTTPTARIALTAPATRVRAGGPAGTPTRLRTPATTTPTSPRGAARCAPGYPRRSRPTSTSSSRSAPSSAGPPPPPPPTASASSTRWRPGTSSRPPPSTPEPAGAPPSSTPTAPPPPTPAPPASTPGPRKPHKPQPPQPRHAGRRHPDRRHARHHRQRRRPTTRVHQARTTSLKPPN